MKKIITAVLILISFASFGQSGVDSTTINTSTPMAAKQYQFKYLKVDSGLSVRKRFFAKDSAFFSGRTYTSVLPASDDSSNQVPNTKWVKQEMATVGIGDTAGRWVYAIAKNSTGDSIIYYRGGIRYAVKDSIGIGSFARDTIVAGRGLTATTINAMKVQLDNDSAIYIVTQINDSTLSFTHYDGRIDTVSMAGSGSGGGTPGIDDVLAQAQVLTTSRSIDIGGGATALQIYGNAFPNIVAEFNADGALISSANGLRSYQAVDSLYAITNHTSSDTSKYKPFGISPDGGAVRMNNWPVGTGGGWGLTGNSGTTLGTNFIGTTDSVGLAFKTNGVPSGGIGIADQYIGLGRYTAPYGSYNVTIGTHAKEGVSSGDYNVTIGQNAGVASAGSGNVYVGQGSGNSSAGSYNAFLGTTAGASQYGNYVVGMGQNVLNFSSGDSCTALGALAGYSNDGIRSTFLGMRAGGDNNQYRDIVALGYNATASANKQLVISDSVVQIKATGITGATNNGYVLTTNGSGVATFQAASGSGGSPAGNYGNIQINRNGIFDTPAGDSLGFSSGALQILGGIVSSGNFTGNDANGIASLTLPSDITLGDFGIGDIGNYSNGARLLGNDAAETMEITAHNGITMNGSLNLSGAFMPNNLAGTAGQKLTSAGTGTPPVWKDTTAHAVSTLTGLGTGVETFLSTPTYNNLTDAVTTTLDIKLKAYAAMGSTIVAQNVDGDLANGVSSQVMVDTRVYFSAVYLPKATTLTGVKWYQVTAGSYTGDAYNGVGLYTYSGGTLTLVASSTNDANIWTATGGTIASKAFSSTYAAPAGLYFVAYLYNNSAQTTAPVLGIVGGASTINTVTDFTNSAKTSSLLSSQTALPSPTQAMSGLTASATEYKAFLY